MADVLGPANRAKVLMKYGYGGGGQALMPGLDELIDDILATCLPFVSPELAGTGSPQNIPHGLGQTPTRVFAAITDPGVGQTIVEGAHTATDVVVTVSEKAKFKVLVWI